MALNKHPAALSYRMTENYTQERSRFPAELFELPDSSILACDRSTSACQVWLDGSQPPRALTGEKYKGATKVIPLTHDFADGDLLVTNSAVIRSGSTSWSRLDLTSPYAAVVLGDTVLVSCKGFRGQSRVGAMVVELAMHNGRTTGTLGNGVLLNPKGIAVGSDGAIFVADWDKSVVQVTNCNHESRVRAVFSHMLFNNISSRFQSMVSPAVHWVDCPFF